MEQSDQQDDELEPHDSHESEVPERDKTRSNDAKQSRLPLPNPAANQEGKHFIVADDGWRSPLEVTVTGGDIGNEYAPGDLIAKLASHVHALLRDVGGGFPPMLYAVLPSNSMTLYFGDPQSEEAQGHFPVELILSHAHRVAGLIDLDGDELFAKACEIGAPARRYSELVHFVENERLTLNWRPRDEQVRVLTPQRAAMQYARLTAEPSTRDHHMTIHGTLYRVIAEPQQGRLGTSARGTLGIRLFGWSAKPQSKHRQGRKVLALYLNEEVESSIRAGLIGSAVEATLIIRQPDLGTAIDPEVVELMVDMIKSGPSEQSRLGTSVFDDTINDGPIDE